MSGPTFEKTTADQHYKDKYDKPGNIDVNQLNWFPEVNPPTIKYNLLPYTPKDIKHALYKKCSSSAPGEDWIVYAYLKKMTYIHKVLATVFTFIREKGEASEEWGEVK